MATGYEDQDPDEDDAETICDLIREVSDDELFRAVMNLTVGDIDRLQEAIKTRIHVDENS